MKNSVIKFVAEAAIGYTKANVNSACGLFLYQSKLPDKSEKLKKK